MFIKNTSNWFLRKIDSNTSEKIKKSPWLDHFFSLKIRFQSRPLIKNPIEEWCFSKKTTATTHEINYLTIGSNYVWSRNFIFMTKIDKKKYYIQLHIRKHFRKSLKINKILIILKISWINSSKHNGGGT